MGDELKREAFADEQAWIAYKQNLARIEREETLKRVQASHAKRHKRPKQSERIRLAYQRMRYREQIERDPEFRVKRHEWWQRSYYKDVERSRRLRKLVQARFLSNPRHREAHRLSCAWWKREHPVRVQELAHMRIARRREKMQADPVFAEEQRATWRETRKRYVEAHREEINARKRAKRAEKKARRDD